MNVCIDLHPIDVMMQDGTTYLDKEIIEELLTDLVTYWGSLPYL
jgi:hypothetical protein